ncbi:flagellar biosynthesis protein FlhF [Paenibacillus daejeonensis]|uniref:flagellar biosynthesis protein FlhF n=1 Tax=Paenibacillus daejeonensis TaxID=135193 RepID=UPI0003626412|nr:flagellar biosynthesis protein FlhF [Paenibacillus daejeonensis]
MRVKRYIVNTVPEALPAIRNELGKDAVILGTKEIYVGGFMGMFRKKKMEVIAAVESETAPAPSPKPARPAAKPTASKQAAAQAYGGTAPRAAPKREAEAPVVQPPRVEDQPLASIPQPQADRPILQEIQLPKEPAAPSADQHVLMEEIREMKQLVTQWSKHQAVSQMPPSLHKLQARLQEQEVTDAWSEQLMAEIQQDEAYTAQASSRDVWMIASRVLQTWLAPLADQEINDRIKIIQFVGPTGVGKTTTIAKLAAHQTLRNKRKVGFITSDTYRIAAVDQLRTYANILNVPMEVVFSPSELSKAFAQLNERDLIMVDTAGRNFRNTLYVSEVNSLLQAGEGCLTYLVLSLTGKSRDMAAVAEQFATFGVDRVIFTKRDETDTFGAILNVMLSYRYKSAFIAHGQTVPDDIEPFRIDNFVEQLLGEIPDE